MKMEMPQWKWKKVYASAPSCYIDASSHSIFILCFVDFEVVQRKIQNISEEEENTRQSEMMMMTRSFLSNQAASVY